MPNDEQRRKQCRSTGEQENTQPPTLMIGDDFGNSGRNRVRRHAGRATQADSLAEFFWAVLGPAASVATRVEDQRVRHAVARRAVNTAAPRPGMHHANAQAVRPCTNAPYVNRRPTHTAIDHFADPRRGEHARDQPNGSDGADHARVGVETRASGTSAAEKTSSTTGQNRTARTA